MKDQTFKQCVLHRDSQVLIGWIPTRGAVLGAHVEVPETDADGDVRRFWIVQEVFDKEMTRVELKSQQNKARESFASIK